MSRCLLVTFMGIITLAGCSSTPDAQSVINRAIENHGGQAYENSRVSFEFRDIEYTATHQNGQYTYTRFFPDSLGGIRDSLTNQGFYRTINGEPANLSFEEDSMYSNSVNSVIYFALLPHKLNDPAVNKAYLEQTTINGKPYHEIEVTFDQQGGGDDYQDRYIYWIHAEDYTMDYLAYRFQVDGGGTRFRESKNVRMINGIRFADYNNFGSPEMEHPLENYETYFQQDTLSKVSEINLESVQVEILQE